jgi:hypothetical protein
MGETELPRLAAVDEPRASERTKYRLVDTTARQTDNGSDRRRIRALVNRERLGSAENCKTGQSLRSVDQPRDIRRRRARFNAVLPLPRQKLDAFAEQVKVSMWKRLLLRVNAK